MYSFVVQGESPQTPFKNYAFFLTSCISGNDIYFVKHCVLGLHDIGKN